MVLANTGTTSSGNAVFNLEQSLGGSLYIGNNWTVNASDGASFGNALRVQGSHVLNLNDNSPTLDSLSLPAANASSSTTINGNGMLTIDGAAPFNFGVSGGLGSNVRTAAMDMTGLAGFTYAAPTQIFRVGAQPGVSTSGSGRPDSSFLAANNTSITALSFLLGDQAGSGTGGNNVFRLGETTAINADTINIGASGRSNATLDFNTGLTAPEVTIRATDGSSRVSDWQVGRVANFNTATWTAIANFSGGEIDAMVDNLRVGILNTTNQSNRQGTQNSSFIMGKGNLDVTNLVIGEQSGTYANNTAGGTYRANGTFTLNHADGQLTANSIRLAENTGDLAGGTRSISGTLNLEAGTIEAGEIRLGDQTATSPAAVTRNFNFSGGTVRNLAGQDLTISDVPVNLTGSGTRVFEATSGQSITMAADTVISGAGGFTKEGDGTMTIASNSTHSGPTIVSAGTLLVSGQLTASNVLVQSGATIGGTGTIAQNLGFDANAMFEIVDINNPLTLGGTVTFGSGFGIANLFGIDWDDLDLHTPYTLITSGQTFTTSDIGNFGIANAANVGTGRQAYFQDGSLQIVVIPEPATALLGGLGMLLALRRTRS